MDISPSINSFTKEFEAGNSQTLWTTLPADMLTPVAAMKKVKTLSPYHLFFESVEGGEIRARYSIIAIDPDIIWKCSNGKPQINREAISDLNKFENDGDDVFSSLRSLLAETTLDIPPELPPMAAGIFGYMGYDMVRHMEALPDDNPDTLDIPESIYIRPRIVIIFDSVKDEAIIVTTVWNGNETSAGDAYHNAAKRLFNVVECLQSPLPVDDKTAYDTKNFSSFFTSNIEKDEYCQIVERAKEYIRAGDVFQIVPSRRLSKPFDLPPFSFYRALRHLNPSPYLFFANMGEFTITGSSPEILVRVKDGVISIRPIAGTRPRGKTPEEDVELEKELLCDEKELAEHLMLLDLARNDVGRAAKPATVCVTEEMLIERYSHVMHIVSNVDGDIRPDCDAIDALAGGFPAGTVSGAPKIRAMEIIDELEKERRSFYGGTVGYFSANGDMDTCITLRTALIKDKMLYIQAGGGVVADSNPEAEFEETQNKANALVRASDMAVKFL